MKETKKYTIILQPEADPEFKGYYNALVPALPGCFSYGANRKEALSNIREAIELYIEDLLDAGESIPEDQTEQVQLEVTA
ncbi:MAG: type II toxin-antitoxin system HicB family antitoxin [Chloroflexi bacterium]|nr:type II toxin-antitoxin system HicB family antitoxin [Chloroflexota bacterium]